MSEQQLRICDGPFRAFLDPGFAGPMTTWRAVNIDDGSTWEGCELGAVPAHGFAEAPAGTELVLDENGHALVLAPSAAGATLGELIDATTAEGARMDPAICVHVICGLTPIALGDVARAPVLAQLSSDHVLVGFDGSVRSRAHLPWWGPVPPVRVPADRRTFPEYDALHLLGEVVAEVLTSRRWPPPGLVLPTLPKGLRRKARQQLRLLLDETTVSVRDLVEYDDGEFDHPMIDVAAARAGLLGLARAVAPATSADLGALVQNVFGERWANEQRARAISDAAMTSSS